MANLTATLYSLMFDVFLLHSVVLYVWCGCNAECMDQRVFSTVSTIVK